MRLRSFFGRDDRIRFLKRLAGRFMASSRAKDRRIRMRK